MHIIKGENVPVRADFVKEYSKAPDKADSRATRRRPTALRGGFDDDEEEVQVLNQARDRNQVLEKPMVETYVEVKIQYHNKFALIKQTRIDEGKMPKWNQVLTFPLEALNATKFTKEELIKSQSMIIVSLFDREKYTTTNMEGNLVQLEENRFLGSF